VRNLPRLRTKIEKAKNELIAGTYTDRSEPTFRRLFTHATWERYTGGSPLRRWLKLLTGWSRSSVLKAVWPSVMCISTWALLVAMLCPKGVAARLGLLSLFPSEVLAPAMGLMLSLQAAAIGLLLVFRTNNAYSRLEEARSMWGDVIFYSREIVSKSVVALDYPVVCEMCRYLCALTWSLRDKLRSSSLRDDILTTLLSKDEAEWICTQRSRPLSIIVRMRQLLWAEFSDGNLPSHFHYLLENDLKEIDQTVASCERLFTSPIPPNMARHGLRSLTIWLLALPLVLAGSMPTMCVVLWVASTSYIYMGLDELGAQVEQPFKIMPLWQLCHLAQLNVEEALSSPNFRLRLNRKTKDMAFPDGVPFG